MKKLILSLSFLAFLSACQEGPKRLDKLAGDQQEASYSIGFSVGQSFKNQGMEVSLDALVTGLMDALEEKEGKLDEKTRQETLMNLQMSLREKAMKKHESEAKKNHESEEKFLAEYAKKEGVKKTESGIMYKVLNPGKGKTPKKNAKVKVHYQGSLADGTVFDSSIKRGQPAEFTLNGVIPGWSEALQLMQTGAKWEVVIPSALAYGSKGAGNRIPPNSPLVFEIELLAIL